MSSLWTPSGEHFPEEEARGAPLPEEKADAEAEAEAQQAVDAMREQLARTPAEVVVANHCYGLFELAAVYLSQQPPMLLQARLAVDGLGALLGGLEGRLGEAEAQLRESLSQLRLAYVRLEGAERTVAEQAAAHDGAGATGAAHRGS